MLLAAVVCDFDEIDVGEGTRVAQDRDRNIRLLMTGKAPRYLSRRRWHFGEHRAQMCEGSCLDLFQHADHDVVENTNLPLVQPGSVREKQPG
jgi:hypothetical protein